MLAESGSKPANIRAGKVIRVPPPAMTFIKPATKEARIGIR
jgi:hypothetical protein